MTHLALPLPSVVVRLAALSSLFSLAFGSLEMVSAGSVTGWIFVVVMVIGTVVVLVLANNRANRDLAHESEDLTILPFAGFVSGATSSTLTDLNGNPQIRCPAGKKISILGAFVEVYDPFLQCWPNGPTADFTTTCTSTPGGGTPGGTPTGAPGGGTPGGVWSSACSNNTNATFQNKTCLPPSGVSSPAAASASTAGTVICARRDASAYIAAQCDGQNTCPLVIDSSTVGPLPCATYNGTGMVALSSAGMASLPLVPGITAQGATPTTEQGYNFHGIFVCR